MISENIERNSTYPVYVSFWVDGDTEQSDTTLRRHEEIEVLLIHSGPVILHTETRSITLQTGQVAFINQQVTHSIEAVPGEIISFYSLAFSPDFLFGSDYPNLARKYLTPLLQNPNACVLTFSEDFDADIIAIIRDVISSHLAGAFGYELYVRSRLCQFWHKLLLQKNQHAASASSHALAINSYDYFRIKQAVNFMEKHFAESITLDDISSSMHVSKNECCRCFRRSLEITPFEYLLRYRIYVSVIKLCQPENALFSIAELADASGFSNASYYNKIFKKYLHCTPSEYRQKSGMITSPCRKILPGDTEFFHPLP